MLIDENSKVPKYVQIHNWLSGMIRRGNIRKGDQLPTEEELARMFGVNRMTVRQAIDAFVNERMVVRQRGKGTFLVKDQARDLIHELHNISSFADDMERMGLTPTTETLKVEVIEADARTQEMLGLTTFTKVIHTLRVRKADGEAVLIERSYLPYREFSEILNEDLSGSLYHLLVEKFKVNLHHSTQVFSAVISTVEDQRIFGLADPCPCIQLESVIYDPDNIPIELLISCYRGDKYRFKVEAGEYLFEK